MSGSSTIAPAAVVRLRPRPRRARLRPRPRRRGGVRRPPRCATGDARQKPGRGRAAGVRPDAPSSGSCSRIWRSSRRSDSLGSSPSSAARCCRPSWYTCSACAWRPARYSASISSPRRRSRSGWRSTSASSSPISSSSRPSARSASIRSSSAVSRSSSRPSDLRLRERLVREVGEGRPAPERERVTEPIGCQLRVVPAERLSSLLEPGAGTRRRRATRERCAGRIRARAFRASRSAASPSASASAFRSRETYACSVFAAVAGGRLAPEVVDERVLRHDLVRPQEQRGQQRALLGAAEVEPPAVLHDLEWAEDPKLHRRS